MSKRFAVEVHMKKKSVSRNILTFFGVGLILLGVVWTCLQLSQPDELNAAPGPVRVMQRGNTKQTTPPPDPATQDEETLFPTLDSEPAPLLLSASPLDEADSAVFPDEPVFEPDTPISELPAAEPAAPIAVAPNTSPVLSPTPRPGSVDMEGPQTAQLIVIKEIPEEVSFQTESFYRVHVKNAGNTVARGVVIRDAVPEGARFVSSEPQTAQLLGSELTWPPFDMKPNEERVFECRFIPEQEGVIGSTATVTFATEASGKTTCTRPQLHLAVNAPSRATIGESIKFSIKIKNTGTGTAKGVTLLEKVPEGLTHPSGQMLNNVLGDIQPGETKELALSLRAAAPGPITNVMSVSSESGLHEETATEITVDAPELALEILGAKERYLQREAVYRLKVWNPGSAPAKGVKLTAELPKELQFVRTNNEGVYQESTQSVHWELVELPEKTAPGEIELVLNPVTIGSAKIIFRGEDNQQLSAQTEQEVTVDGITALSYRIESLSGAVEHGNEAVFEVRLENKGTKDANRVEMVISLPDGVVPVNMDGPTQFTASGNTLVFAPIAKIGPKEERVYKLKVKCNLPGDRRLTVKVGAEGIEPLTKEESVWVY
ncbi:MAG: hypothetical protein ACOX6D_05860 [Thermoguttaceae bacterium]|jgi:uncharacterized repeat protein (TIGR01451 family)